MKRMSKTEERVKKQKSINGMIRQIFDLFVVGERMTDYDAYNKAKEKYALSERFHEFRSLLMKLKYLGILEFDKYPAINPNTLKWKSKAAHWRLSDDFVSGNIKVDKDGKITRIYAEE